MLIFHCVYYVVQILTLPITFSTNLAQSSIYTCLYGLGPQPAIKATRNLTKLSSLLYTFTMHPRMASHLLMVGWLALLVSVWTSTDQVIDLVFEEPDVTVDTQSTAEEPDNATEHLLMPSRRVGSSASDITKASPAADLDAFSIAVHVTDNAAQRPAPPHYRPPRSRPASFSVPLRI